MSRASWHLRLVGGLCRQLLETMPIAVAKFAAQPAMERIEATKAVRLWARMDRSHRARFLKKIGMPATDATAALDLWDQRDAERPK